METETFYIGSRKENSQLLLRVYNKKAEQINTNGFRLNEALECENWLRLEASMLLAAYLVEYVESKSGNASVPIIFVVTLGIRIFRGIVYSLEFLALTIDFASSIEILKSKPFSDGYIVNGS